MDNTSEYKIKVPLDELIQDHQDHLEKELGSKDAVQKAYEYGARSLSKAEAIAMGFKVKGPEGKSQSTGGIHFPYEGGFAHLRCDEVPQNSDGNPCKYLAKAGSKFRIKQFGDGDPLVATEGWKDALRIHLDTGKTTVALPSITGWKQLPSSIEFIVYDADAAHNPHVWGQLIRAGIVLQSAHIGFWNREIAGDKGGACEYFNEGGTWESVAWTRPKPLLKEIWKGWSKNLRADYIRGNIVKLIRLADELNFLESDTEILLNQAKGKLGITADYLKRLMAKHERAKERLKRIKDPVQELDESALPEEPDKEENPHFAHERVVLLLPYFKDHWRADYELEKSWCQHVGTHWEGIHSNDPFNRALEETYNEIGWAIRDSSTVRCDREGLRRAIGGEMGSPDPKLIPFTNCCLNWETGELIPHSPMLWNRYSLPFDYDPKAPSPKIILDFLKDRLEKDEVIALFRAFVWHVITGRSMKCFLEVSGPGNTGKSVLAALLQAAVGSVNIAATSLQRIEDTTNRFETYKLRGKRLLVCSESQGYSGQMEMLKAITGGDLITAERKNSVAPVDFYFLGGVLLMGNSPVRPSDRSSAVVNRRRSIQVTKVVNATDERQLLERDGAGGFQGELVPELGAFIKWVLEMDPTEARKAISRDITSFARANTEKEILLETDHLARWANERLIFDERASSSVGTSAGLLNDFTDWYQVNVGGKTYGQHNFKDKLVTLLRDVLCAPLPNGSLQKNPYRKREVGSVVPYVRLRDRHEDAGISGVVDWFFHKRVRVTTRNESVNGKRPVGNGRNEGNGISEPRSQCEEESRSEHPQQEPSKKSSGIYE